MPAWLTARPIAHRGLHGGAIVENTPTAFSAAIMMNYAFETDLRLSADGEAMVHHDEALGRLTDGAGRLADVTASELRRVAFRDSADRMIGLGELCDLVAGRATMLLELKGDDARLVDRVAAVLAAYRGPVAVMSFNPVLIAVLRERAPDILRGVVSQRSLAASEWVGFSLARKFAAAHVLHAPVTRPQFLAYKVDDLPAPATMVARACRVPVLTWTVRTPAQRRRAAAYADQMIFEGFRP